MNASDPETKPLVSIVVTTFNRPELVQRAVGSVFGQSYRPLEVVVVNDAGSVVHKDDFDLPSGVILKVHNHQENGGISAARNTGQQLSEGEYVGYLDDDDELYPDHVALLVEKLLAAPQAEVAYSNAKRIHRAGGAEAGREHTDYPFGDPFDRERLLVSNYIPTPCLLHHRNLIDKVGSFDTTLATHEDWEYWIRLASVTDFTHVNEVTCAYSWRSNGGSLTAEKRENFLSTMREIHDRAVNLSRDPDKTLARQRKVQTNLEKELRGDLLFKFKSRLGDWIRFSLLRHRKGQR